MGFLKDTCIIINKLNTGDLILKAARHCKSVGKEFIISDVVRNELNPSHHLEIEKKKEADILCALIDSSIKFKAIKLIPINSNSQIEKNYSDIRLKYYGWIKNTQYLTKLVESGILKHEEVSNKNLKNKDAGECSLIAIALTDPLNYIIVSDDRGTVYAHPDINIFDKCCDCKGIKVLNFPQWKRATSFIHD